MYAWRPASSPFACGEPSLRRPWTRLSLLHLPLVNIGVLDVALCVRVALLREGGARDDGRDVPLEHLCAVNTRVSNPDARRVWRCVSLLSTGARRTSLEM